VKRIKFILIRSRDCLVKDPGNPRRLKGDMDVCCSCCAKCTK